MSPTKAKGKVKEKWIPPWMKGKEEAKDKDDKKKKVVPKKKIKKK